jgi:acyltransferase
MTVQADAFVAPPPGSSKQHFDWVDNAKVLLIFLVVLGHFHYALAPVAGRHIIYAFHVPAFLLLTGFLLPSGFGQLPPMAMLRRWVFLYARAYGFFSVMAIAIWWALESAGAGQPVNPWPAISGALYGVSGNDNGLVHRNQPLWYFPFLVTSLMGAWVCSALSDRLSTVLGWTVAFAYASVAMLYSGPRLPWDIEIAGMGVVMILFGRVLRRQYFRVQPFIDRPLPGLALACLLILLLTAISAWNGPTNINRAIFGASGVLFVAGALAGTGAALLLAARLPRTRLAGLISAQTLTIFAVHIYFVRAASHLPLPESWIAQQIMMAALSALIVLACLPLAALLQPFLRRWVELRPANPLPGPTG